jgi:tetratricopeptide (TPR) repeat protein
MAEQLTPAQLVEVVRAERRRRWEQGDRVPAEEFLRRYPALQGEPAYALELVYHEKLLRRELGEQPALEEYLQRFPQFTTQLRALFEVDSWLSASALGPSAAVSTPLSPAATPVERDDQVPPLPCIPGYEILGRLGRGGVGVVYKALHERLHRVVALKMLLVAAHADAAQVARFRSEAEAQARVQHPNIVQIFEVGEADGWPYLALELVEAGTLAGRLSGTPQPARWAAELVETLAWAMQHAHERGLVHRDLKPANVLLSADGTAKISDFGLAKRVQEGAGSPTQSGEILGTPAYMAPEQAAGEITKVGPAADVYALGAILYELLTGRPPFVGANALETLLQVRQQEPVSPRRLLPSIPRDLETITLMCLRKEPARRYASAEALADDLKRFLNGESIVARHVGIVERGVKWARRRPATAALVGVIAMLLFAGPVGGVWYAARERDRANKESALRQKAEQAEEQAKHSAEDTSAVLDFVQTHVLAAGRPESQAGGLGVKTTIREAVDAAEPKIAGAFHDRPLVEAAVRHTLGYTYTYLRESEAAMAQHQRVLELRSKYLGPDHPDTLISMNNLAVAYVTAGQPRKAVPLLEQTLAKKKELLGPDHLETLNGMNNLALAYKKAGELDKAVPLFEQALAKQKEKLGPDDRYTLITMNNLAAAYKDVGQLDKALPLLEETLAKKEEQLGLEHPSTLEGMSSLAAAYKDVGQLDKAVPLFERTLAMRQKKLGPHHPHTLVSMNNLATAYWQVGQLDQAVRLLEEALAKQKEKLGLDHPDTLRSMNNLAMAYSDAHQHRQAVLLLEEALAKHKEKLGLDHPATLENMNNLAMAYLDADQRDEAVRLLEKTLAMRQKKLGPDHPGTLGTMNSLAVAHLKNGDFATAERILREWLVIGQSTRPNAWTISYTQSVLGEALVGQQKYTEAEPLLLAGYEGLKAREKVSTLRAKKRLTGALHRIVKLYDAWGKPEQAAAWRQRLEQAKSTTPNSTK